jgi:hypothetical protein
VPRIELRGTAEFGAVSRALKAAGNGAIAREMNRELKAGAGPLVEDAQRRVRGLNVRTSRGGASARAARAKAALGKKKRPSDRLKDRAHKGAGLRDTVARATSAKTSVTSRSASLRVRAAQAKMPPDQRKLPRYLNDGRWRHPVFGNHTAWVTQTAPPAWFDDAAESTGPKVRDNAIAIVGKYLDHIV